ncbi:hypothetical protein SAMN02800694_2620 [Luteibacter sp. UNCMF331Sha3.1]|uniref:nucleoid-associated protein n=1 Tax=Luteibacter sp. UNCMF331Sha3.1 TaxID=1502760 RepID=UPI0008C3C2FD|nr:nucleoid-associated protein [Luteibacter sp. UNCMF331Sha3.1]SEN05333.1 hypothetical protein SAMN02800694_2620 [Luteibacter sp. UNCMF331Sha3.1]
MGFLGQDEGALHIRAMSLHVVGVPIDEFVPEDAFDDISEEAFFLKRIVENDADAIFSFVEGSTTRSLIERIASNALPFKKGAQDLARNFNSGHVATSRDGAFFVIELHGDDGARFFCLIKYDYSEAVVRRNIKGKSQLRKLVQAFVTDKKAVQKICLVKITDGVASDEVAARDRMRTAPELSDYFYKFLGVKRERDDAELTKAVLNVARLVLQEQKAHLGDRSVAVALNEFGNALRLRPNVDVDVVREVILGVLGNPEDEKLHSAVERSVERKFESGKLHGLGFKPDPLAFKTAKSVKLETPEGVVVRYSQRAGENLVTRVKKAGGGETIIIETDGTVQETVTKVE